MRIFLNIIVILCCAKLVYGQSIEKFSIDSGGASVSAGGIEILYTIGEVAVAERSATGVSVSEGFINSSFRVSIDPKVFLQGPLLNPVTAGLMNDDLRAGDYLPTTSPYADSATVDDSVFNLGGTSGSGTANNDIVDWVWLELRDVNDNETIVRGISALLQRDGDIVGLDGVSTLLINTPPKSYYLVVKHRNHNAVMTLNAVGLFESSTTTVDFKDSNVSTYGTNSRVQLASNDMALWAGNVNGDDRIRYQGSSNDSNSIKDLVIGHPSNTNANNLFFYFAYDNADVNLDGRIRYQGSNNDTNLIKDIVITHPENGTNNNLFFFTGQLPENNN